MLDARIVINVSDTEYAHHNGLAGNFIVPAKKDGEPFGILVIYGVHEIQDVGNQAKTQHWPSATAVAFDVVGRNSDATAHTLGTAGGAEKWGIMLCEASPDIPKELQQAIEEEQLYLGENPTEIKQKRDRKTKMMLAYCIDPPEVKEQKIKLSAKVAEMRGNFHRYCRTLVAKKEVDFAKQHLQLEDQRLVGEGDLLWAGNEAAKRNISELHKGACRRLGNERPWCYVPRQLVGCPGCGAMIAGNILMCPQCQGWLDEGVEELRAMKPKERALKMYPERYGEPLPPNAAGRPEQKKKA